MNLKASVAFVIIMLLLVTCSCWVAEAVRNTTTAPALRGGPTSYTSSHDFAFVSGWPQSGTSFMNQILSTASRDVSTMKERCLKLFAKGCREWNFEGQWILKFHARDKHAANLLNSGSVCQSTEEQPSSAYDGVVATWGKFWDMSKTLLVEKSPQNMLKIATLRRVYARARAVKFVIVIKHPVTLNVALPREYDWMTHKESVKRYREKEAAALRRGEPPPKRAESSNSIAEIAHNAQYFSHFMTQNQTSTLGNRCTMGWLDAMEELHRHLVSDPRNLEEVRVVRFEDFDRPHSLCQRLFAFVFGSNGTTQAHAAGRDVCDRYFTPERTTSQLGGRHRRAPAASQGSRPRAGSTRTGTAATEPSNRNSGATQTSDPSDTRDNNPPHHGRRLRLTGSTEKPDKNKALEFSPTYFQKSTQRRIQQYHDAYDRIASDAAKKQLQAISQRLKPFGYSLERGDEYSYKKEASSVFEPWHL